MRGKQQHTDGFVRVNPQLNQLIERHMGTTAGYVPNNFKNYESFGRGFNPYPVYQTPFAEVNAELTGSKPTPYGDWSSAPDQFEDRPMLSNPMPVSGDPRLGLSPPPPAKGFEFQAGSQLFAPSNLERIDQGMAQIASPPQNTQRMPISTGESVGMSTSVGPAGAGPQRNVTRQEA